MKRIAFIGTGRMGGAMAKSLASLSRDGFAMSGEEEEPSLEVVLYDPAPGVAEAVAEGHSNVSVAESVNAAVEGADIVILATKPGDIVKILVELPVTNETIVISIAAGVSLEAMLSSGTTAQVVRVMPNLCVQVGQSPFAVMGMDESSTETVAALLRQLGPTVVLKDEGLFDVWTGLVGSGPALVATFIEGLVTAGIDGGLTADQAMAAAIKVVRGTAQLLEEQSLDPAVFRRMVCSAGGTTIAGVVAAENMGFGPAATAFVGAAAARSRELGQKKK